MKNDMTLIFKKQLKTNPKESAHPLTGEGIRFFFLLSLAKFNGPVVPLEPLRGSLWFKRHHTAWLRHWSLNLSIGILYCTFCSTANLPAPTNSCSYYWSNHPPHP